MNRRKSSIRSARIFRFAASPDANPTSSNTLSLPRTNGIWFGLLLSPPLDRPEALPPKNDFVSGGFLCFLLERVEYINRLLVLCNIKNPRGAPSVNSDFLDTSPTQGMGLKSVGSCPPCSACNSNPTLRRASL